jgi:hypothetical protein
VEGLDDVKSAGRVRIVLMVLLVASAALVFGINAALRPGCSLLPVTLSDTAEFQPQPATLEQACAALGRPLPHPATLPDGARRSGIGIDSAPLSLECCRVVHVSYAMNGRTFAMMTIHRQDAIPIGNASEVNAMLAGVPAVIQQRRPPTLDADNVSYLWARDGLLYGLNVALRDGITREAADAMAASIR